MSDAIYPSAKQAFLSNTVNWLTDPIVCVLVGTANYNFSKNHQSLADIPVAARIAVSGTLAGRSATLGVADASDITFSPVFGNPANAVVICKSTGTDLSSPLIAYLDTVFSGFPLVPSGNPVTIQWDNGASKIFAL